MKRKRRKYVGVIIPDIKTLDEKITTKRIKPGQKPDAVEQLIFNENLELVVMELPDIKPAYVKKYLKH